MKFAQMRCKDTAFLPNSKHFCSFLLPFHLFLSRHRIVVRRKKRRIGNTFLKEILSSLRKNALFCVRNELNSLNIYNKMKKYIGIAAIVLGALLLVVSYLTGNWVDYNSVQILALLLIIAGIVGHIIITKRPS